ncbi:hypothetical protein [Streptomyces sp. ADI95-17]|uniref:hypothetical protein n=1 Tax=Streptomyces sp. ADI95-17 TaxID=1522759 RepID=UPI000F5BE497|nr:hypothetical protein [Streptomyces sp. ADI95-17]RPK55817.1 hypothetical protein EES42_41725 [Streptomyces sp. ADI95-17]
MTPTAKTRDNLLRGRTLLIGTALVGCSVFVMTACSSGGDENPKASSTPSSAKSSVAPSNIADPDAAAKRKVLGSYDRMWTEQMKAYHKADEKGTDLQKYATLDALGQVRNDLARMREAGTVVRGDVEHSKTEVKSIDLSAKTPKASVKDCMDISGWQTYNTRDKRVQPMPPGQKTRYWATATAERWDGQWLITSLTPHGDDAC